MKTFKTHLTEKAVDGGYPVDTDSFANDLANPKNIERINSFLGAMGGIEYLVPEHAMNKVQEKLARIGIQFDMPTLGEDGGKVSVPITVFGGRAGEDDNGEKIDDDGISHKVEGGMSIEFMHEKTAAGTHFISAKLV